MAMYNAIAHIWNNQAWDRVTSRKQRNADCDVTPFSLGSLGLSLRIGQPAVTIGHCFRSNKELVTYSLLDGDFGCQQRADLL